MKKTNLKWLSFLLVGVVSIGFTSCGSDEVKDEPANSSPDKAPATVEAVDLGLSVKWASCNVGATQEWEYGGCYAWGEVTEKEDYSVETYLYYDANTKKYQDIGDDIAGTKYDVAHVLWGGKWRMPTAAQMKELIDKCEFTRSSRNKVEGIECKGPNGNILFFPCAPHQYGTEQHTGDVFLWCSTITSMNNKGYAYYANGWGILEWDDDEAREDGLSVRAIMP